MPRAPRHALVLCLAVLSLATGVASGCRRTESTESPVATATVKTNLDRAPVGSPLEITYTFVVANDAKISGDYRVMLHVVEPDEELVWTDDHTPPVPTSTWKPGQTVQYTRTIFVPVFPYVGSA